MGRFIRGTRSGSPGPQSLTVSGWVIPTTKADGSALTPDAQTLHYGTSSVMGTGGTYPNSLDVGSASATSKVITGLQASTTYYIAASVSVAGVRGEYSVEVSGTTPA